MELGIINSDNARRSEATTTKSSNKLNWTKQILLILLVLLCFQFVLLLFYFIARPDESSQQKNVNNLNYKQEKTDISENVNWFTNVSSLNSTKDNTNNQNCSLCCQTESCQMYSQLLSMSMDISADPCDDFYQYVCGNRPQNMQNLYTRNIVSNLMELGNILEAGISNSTSKSKAVQYVMNLCKEYVDAHRSEQFGNEPIRQLLKQVTGKEQWPMLAEDSSSLTLREGNSIVSSKFENSSGISKNIDSSEFATFRSNWKSWKLFSNKTLVSDDPANVAQWMDCYVEASLVGVHSLIDDVLSWDKKTWEGTNTITLRQVDASEDVGDLFAKYSELRKLIVHIDQWNTSLDHAIFEVMHFNLTLSRILKSKSVEWSELAPSKRKSMTLSELKLNHSSSAFDWTLLLNKFASRAGASFRYTDDHSVRVNIDQLDEFKPFTELIANTNIRVLTNLIAFQVIRDKSIQKLLKANQIGNRIMFRTKSLGKKERIGMSILFVNDVIESKHFHSILTRLFIDKVGREQMRHSRDTVIDMASQLKKSFSDSIKNDHDWLDDQTRQNALDKLDTMKSMVAFPDWIFDDEILDEQFGFTNNSIDSHKVIKGNYAASYLNLRRLEKYAIFRQIGQILPKDRHFIFYSTAGYLPILNAILIPYTNLLNLNYSSAIDYSNFGFIIGHEMAHGFGSRGVLYDKHGELTNWWTDSAKGHFDKLTKCFVRQYDGMVEPITGIKINGTFTLGENIADNVGMNVAYRAFSKTLKHSNSANCAWSCPSFQAQFTPQQLFFISHGMNWCSSQENSTELVELIRNDPHSPNRLRVNVPLSNMAQFAQAFNCPVGSNMNPKHKCSIW